MNGKSGSAYVYVAILITTVTLMYIMALGVTAYEAKVTDAYGKYAGLHYIGASGAETAAAAMNAELRNNAALITRAASDNILRGDLSGKLEYVLEPDGDIYGGRFLFYNNSKNNLFRTAFDAHASAYMRDYLMGLNNNMAFFDFAVDNGSESYKVIADFTIDATKSPTEYTFTQTAYSAKTGVRKKSEAIISLKPAGATYEERLSPIFAWNDALKSAPGNPYKFYSFPISSADIATEAGATAITNNPLNPAAFYSEAIDKSVSLANPSGWTPQNPLLQTTGGTIDAAQFYIDGTPIPSIIIGGTGTLTISANSANNRFTGLIITEGDIIIDNATITGGVICRGRVTLRQAATVISDADAVFRAAFTDAALHRRIMDFLRVTSFKSMTAIAPATRTTNIAPLLGFAAVAPGGSVEIKGFDDLRLEVIKLQEIN